MAGVRYCITEWLRAVRWRKRIESALAPSGLTFTQWLVLDATRTLFRATEDAVSQGDVAAHLEMHRATVSEAMIALDRKGLVDRGCAAEGPSWRIILTDEASQLLKHLEP
ncbi:MAG TPA: MarR family transcriptional regulator, partial [Polyangiaceae bacterium]